MKCVPIKLQQHFEGKWTLKEKGAVMWHILTLEIQAEWKMQSFLASWEELTFWTQLQMLMFWNWIKFSEVLFVRVNTPTAVPCDTGLDWKFWVLSVVVTEANWEQSRFSKNQHSQVAEMFVFWFCSLISGLHAYERGGYGTKHSLWKGRKCSSRMFTMHFLLPSCLFSGLGLCWVFLPHAFFPFPNVCLSWHTG